VLPPRPVIGILHPGAMGAAVGAALKPAASAVIWAAAGRSLTTSKRAETADLVGVPDLAELVHRSDVIISVCPPDAARAVAEEVAGQLDRSRPGPLFVEANAVSPATVADIAELLGAERVVDGAIIGPPAWEPGRTVVWLAGSQAPGAAALFAGSPFAARVLDGPLGAASALKACFALQSKALPTLWVALDTAARAYGVADEIREELHRTGVDLDAHLARIDAQARGKAWRWVGEMQEAADAFAAVGLPDGFSRAAAATYERMAAADPTDRANPWGLRGPGGG
jgi:3-hydroxyisobutyrate dehydrogenase-like beta-hydroxyacid dehydrogenase